MKRQNDITKKFLTLVFSIAFQQFMLALVSASDALMLGALTQDSLSAVSLASQVTFAENLFFLAFFCITNTLMRIFTNEADGMVTLI